MSLREGLALAFPGLLLLCLVGWIDAKVADRDENDVSDRVQETDEHV